MIKILRNREVKLHFLFVSLLGAVGMGLGFIQNTLWWPCLAMIGIIACSASFTLLRYRKLARLSQDIAHILNGNYQMDISTYLEGELSILAADLLKLTRILSFQAAQLQKDKSYLADSIADISHQLKTPLTSLSMLCDLLANPALPPDKEQEFLNHIRIGLARIEWLVSALLKLSRLDAGDVSFLQEPINLNELFVDAVQPFLIAMEIKNQTLEMDINKGVILTGDRTWLLEAFSNLIKNCVEHTPEKGKIMIQVNQNNLYTSVTIKDNGVGFEDSDIPYLFNRFYKGKNAAPDSVGIGLALSKSIITRHNGVITAENSPEGGAVFAIKFYGRTVV